MKSSKPKADHKSAPHAFAKFDKRKPTAPKRDMAFIDEEGGTSRPSSKKRRDPLKRDSAQPRGEREGQKASKFEPKSKYASQSKFETESKSKYEPKSKFESKSKYEGKGKYDSKSKEGAYAKKTAYAPKNEGKRDFSNRVGDVINFANQYKGKKAEVCEVYYQCGACHVMHLPYEAQLEAKQKAMNELLGGFGPVSPIIGMDSPLHYRNKVHATFKNVKGYKVIAGMYEEGSHNVVQSKACLLQDERANKIISTIAKLMESFKMKAYDEDYASGVIRHVMVRTSYVSGEIMVVLVIGSKILPAKNNFVRALLEAHPEITTVIQNHNSRSTSMVLGDQETVIYGKGFIEDTLCETVFRISPKSFYQVNPVQTEVLYNKAISFAGLTGNETVLDAYCGIGTIGLIASKHAKEVIGVELNKDAVRDAISNARRNGIKNTRFYEGDAGEFMRAVADEKAKLDVVFMDPPRAGSDEAFLSSLVHLAPSRVVYVSCEPQTLARDLKYLTSRGYKVKAIQPVDMFPGTKGTEVVVSLQRKL